MEMSLFGSELQCSFYMFTSIVLIEVWWWRAACL